jgi:hypothetical protein
MTLEGKFIQKKGIRKVTLGIIVFFIKSLVNGGDPIPI